jgi:hypothetical protein
MPKPIIQPRYVRKFTNGVHIIFDREKFCVAEVCRSQKEADRKLNGE